MRSPDAIEARLHEELLSHNSFILALALGQNQEQLVFHLSEAYEISFLTALRHRPNGENVDKFATLAWVAGSDLNVAEMPWIQFGMPRIRRLAKELKLPWIPTGDNQATLLKAKRMSNGLPCNERCFHCFKGR